MRYPTISQSNGAARRILGFNLTERALAFAQLYAENPRLGATKCAIQAGYARRCLRGAHVRAYELLRDPRVIRAVMYFAARALNKAMHEAFLYLTHVAASEGRYWNCWDKNAFNRLNYRLRALETHMERIEQIYESVL